MTHHKDRELLELAASAVGYDDFDGHSQQMVDSGWNPLGNDADAFRLMVDTELEVRCYNNGILVETIDCGEFYVACDENSKHAAPRRAIVLAAADIGANSG